MQQITKKKEGIQLNHRMSIPRVHGSETLSCTDIQDVLQRGNPAAPARFG